MAFRLQLCVHGGEVLVVCFTAVDAVVVSWVFVAVRWSFWGVRLQPGVRGGVVEPNVHGSEVVTLAVQWSSVCPSDRTVRSSFDSGVSSDTSDNSEVSSAGLPPRQPGRTEHAPQPHYFNW